MNATLIPFDSCERLLNRINGYVTAVDTLINDGDRAVDLLLKGFPLADDNLKVKIVIMLGTLANERVAWILLDIMCNTNLNESIRQSAAIQLSVVGGLLADASSLTDRLLEELGHSCSQNRANAVFALGWEGNVRAAPKLIDCLTDHDMDVQQAAVSALSNLRDDRLFNLLAKRLQIGSKDQQRSILYNLGHFPSKRSEIIEICKAFIHHGDPDLRYDALIVLNSMADPNQIIGIYDDCLQDTDLRIRELALTRLAAVDRQQLTCRTSKLKRLASDPSAKVRQAATRLLHRIDSIFIAASKGNQ